MKKICEIAEKFFQNGEKILKNFEDFGKLFSRAECSFQGEYWRAIENRARTRSNR